MRKGSALSSNVAPVIITVAFVAAIAWILACAPPSQPQLPLPPYSFVYTPPEQAQRSLPITIGIVRPSYADPKYMAQRSQRARDTMDAFRSSMASDFERILVAKGFKITGPYDDLDVMTFPEKKGVDLTLTPAVGVQGTPRVTTRSGSGSALVPFREDGVLVLSGYIQLVLSEPLSGEKIWIKRIEVEPVETAYVHTHYTVSEAGRVQSITVNDTRPHALIEALNRIYPKVMQQAWVYFHPEEVMHAKQEAEEVRKLKRY